MGDSGETPFQKLQFLVRDWSYPYEAQWGAEGGKDLITRRLEVSERQHPELQNLRRHIKNCFSSIEGFLMPHPGLRVSTDPEFDGRMKDIESTFTEKLSEFVPLILAPDNVVVKRIGGNEVRCKEIIAFFKAYIEVFTGDEMPEPKSMLQATSEANNLASLSEAKDTYIAMMESVCGGDKPYINERVLDIEHCKMRDQPFKNSRWKFSALEGKWAAKKVRLNTGNSLRESWTSSTAIIGLTTRVRTSLRLPIPPSHLVQSLCSSTSYVNSSPLSASSPSPT